LNEDEKRELTSLAHRQPDAGGCLIYQRLALAAIVDLGIEIDPIV